MGITSFMYRDLPSSTDLLDQAAAVLVNCECLDNIVEADQCERIVSGLVDAAIGLRVVNNEDYDPPTVSGTEAENLWYRTFIEVYCKAIDGEVPKEGNEPDGIGWWPDGLSVNKLWPRPVLRKLAKIVAKVEVERTEAFYRYCRDEEMRAVRTEGFQDYAYAE